MEFGDNSENIKKAKTKKKLVLFILLIVAGIIFFVSTPIRYRMKIKELKEEYPEFVFFPDSIPQGVSHVKWFQLPSLMQGEGRRELSFIADDEYIQSLYDTYAYNKCIETYDRENGRQYGWVKEDNVYRYYPYDNPYVVDEIRGYTACGWVNKEGEEVYPIHTPSGQDVNDYADVDVIITYEYPSDDIDCYDNGGIYIDHKTNLVYFWMEN
jgi:hypothetical protein